jgi:hypothetical protein
MGVGERPTFPFRVQAMFTKKCKGCGVEIQGARNLQKCDECKKHRPVEGGRKSRFRFDRSTLENRDFRSYFLGFLCTDGSVSLTSKGDFKSVGWYSTDKQIVEDITSYLKYDHKLYFANPEEGEWANCFYADNARLIQTMGLKADKEDHTLADLDVDLYPFLRGHMDGDGSIGTRKTSFGDVVGTVIFRARRRLAFDIKERLAPDFGEVTLDLPPLRNDVINRTKELFEVKLGSTRAERLLEKMYFGSTVSLARKREVWERAREVRMRINAA